MILTQLVFTCKHIRKYVYWVILLRMDSGGAFSSPGAVGDFDLKAFLTKPEVILRISGWVSNERYYTHGWPYASLIISIWVMLQFSGLYYLVIDISVTGTFAPMNFRSRERKFHRVELSLPGAKVPWNFRSLELSFPGTFAPGSESSMELSFLGTFVPWNFRSRERMFHGTFVP